MSVDGSQVGVEQELEYEARVRRRQAILAIVAAVLLIVSPVMELAGAHPKVNELTLTLIAIHQRFPLDVIAAFVQAIGLVALAFTLGWLAARTKVRAPTMRSWIGWVAVSGCVIGAIGWIGSGIAAAHAADQFVASASQTYVDAYNLTSSGLFAILGLLEQILGPLLLAAGFIFVSLNAMRVGLLPRNVGFIGVAAGALVLFPILPVPIVMCFWLAVLAVLLLGRWPEGDLPAWRTGLAVPWTPGERRGRALGGGSARAARGARGQTRAQAARDRQTAQIEDAAQPAAPARTRASTPKRKRKNRS